MGNSNFNKQKFKFRPELFWDTDVNKLQPDKHPTYVIERILDLGDIPDVKWMTGYYPKSYILATLRNSKAISNKSRALWSMVI